MFPKLISEPSLVAVNQKKLTVIQMLWGALVIALGLLILASFLTRYVPHWIGLTAAVGEAWLAPLFVWRIGKLRNSANVSPAGQG